LLLIIITIFSRERGLRVLLVNCNRKRNKYSFGISFEQMSCIGFLSEEEDEREGGM
jgi:hypothetical protein